MVVLVCLGGRGLIYQHRLNQQTLNSQVAVTQRLRVFADDIRINGRLVSLRGQDLQSGQKEAATLILKDDAQEQRIRSIGQTTYWNITGTAQPVMPPTNCHQFDLRRYYHRQGICNQVRINSIQSIQPGRREDLLGACHCLRWHLARYFQQMPAPLADYCQQLIIGQTSLDAGEAMKEAKRLGIIHLFCISGMHVFLLVAMVRLACCYLWLDRELVNYGLIILLPLYLVIAGGSVSLVRAVVMTEVSLLHGLLRADHLDGWALSLLAGLVLEPELLLEIGGQLTYLLSLVLQVGDGQVGRLRQSIFLALVSLPTILNYQFEFHCLSFVVSYPLIPLFSYLIFPAVLVGAATYWLLPGLGLVINQLIHLFQAGIGLLATMPGEVHFGKPPLVLGLLLFLLTLWCLYDYRQERAWVALIGAYLACFAWIHCSPLGEVTFVDIGQGDCIIIREPFNRRVEMIDTGGKVQFGPRPLTQNSGEDQAARTSINYLKSLGISHLDAVYLSHHDADHIGYLPTVLESMQVNEVVVPAGMEGQQAFMRRVRAFPTVRVVPVTDRQKISGSQLTILHPFTSGAGQNEDSMVLAGSFGQLNFVFTGDLDQENEKRVIAKYPQLRADVLKLGHHGSKTASCDEFLDQLHPRWGIISAGRFNRYHHPSDEVVQRLKTKRITPISTQQYGMIRYIYGPLGNGRWVTELQGGELKWTLPTCLNN